ncbi:MAG: TolC family protein [Nitrospirae bacterium]|nr:MAG: TolC family protein [Nitrospirota bacterium]
MTSKHIVDLWMVFLVIGLPGFVGAHVHTPSPASDPERLALAPLIQEALARNPEVVAARQRVEALRARIPQARALDDPELKIQLWNTPETFDVTRTQRTIYGIAQRFPFPGTLSRRAEIASRRADQSVHQLLAKEREIVAAVKTAYYELFYAHKALEIHHEQIALLQQFFAAANAKFRAGRETQVAVLQAQVELAKLYQRLPLLEQRRQTARVHLNTLLDRNPRSPLGIPYAPPPRRSPLNGQEIEQRALRQRPELREADERIKQWETTARLARLRYYPHLRVELQRWQNFNAPDGFGGNVTLNLPFSFWTKPKYDAGVREAAAHIQVARAQKQTLENLTRFHVRDLVTQIAAVERIINLYTTTILPQARQTLKAATAGYRTDRTDFLALLDAERALLTYKLEYFRALVDRERHLAMLERVVGGEL